jgi:hypothetical protein
MIKLIIAVGRDKKQEAYYEFISAYIKEEINMDDLDCIISGGASGIDSHGACWVKSHGVKLEIYKADWAQYGGAAGPIRNGIMAQIGTHLLLIWDGKSKGSKSMLSEAKKYNLEIYSVII